MSFSVDQLPNEPIIFVTVHQLAGYEHFIHDIHEQVASLQAAYEGPCYRIDDLRKVSFSTKQLTASMYLESQDKPGSATDPMIRHVVVSNDRILHFGIMTLPQTHTPDNRTPIFYTLDEAIDYVRAQIVIER